MCSQRGYTNINLNVHHGQALLLKQLLRLELIASLAQLTKSFQCCNGIEIWRSGPILWSSCCWRKSLGTFRCLSLGLYKGNNHRRVELESVVLDILYKYKLIMEVQHLIFSINFSQMYISFSIFFIRQSQRLKPILSNTKTSTLILQCIQVLK